MSHTTKLKALEIKDVTAMQAAVRDLQAKGVNCELKQDVRCRMYSDTQGNDCDYVLQLKDGNYDLGFVKQDDGTYLPVFDEWAGNVAGQLGATCPVPDSPEGRVQHQIGQFAQLYGKHAAINAASAQGYIVEGEITDAEGNIHITVGGM